MPGQVEFFFDYGSPATYIAWRRLPDILARTGAERIDRPMLLGGIFKATGNRSPISVPAKGAWAIKDMARFCARHDIEMSINPWFPINTMPLMRMATAALEDGWLDKLSDVVFPAIWVHGQDMGEPQVVADVLSKAGIDHRALFERIRQPAIKDKLRAVTDEAVARGVFGAPTFFVGQEMFFGQDRLDFVEEALTKG